METKANHLLIGSFVLVLILTAFGFVYWLKNLGAGGSNIYYILFHGSVGGLTQASDVLFNGIKVGKVQSLEIYEQDSRKVRVVVQIGKNIPVKTNSRARIEHQGLTGLAAVQVTAGTPDAELLVPEADGTYPIIKADVASSESLLDSAPEVLGNANAVFVRLNDLIANNEDSIRNTLVSIESFAKVLDKNKEDIGTVISEAKALSVRLNNLANKVESAVDGISSFVSADGNSFLDQAKQSVESFRLLAKKLEKSVGDKAEILLSMAKQSLKEFELFMKDGRRVARNLDRVLERIEQNPQSFLFGGSNVPEYNPSQ